MAHGQEVDNTNQEEQFLPYESTTYGIEILRPSSWEVVEGMGDQQGQITVAEFYSPNSLSTILLTVDTAASGFTVETYLESLIAGDSEAFSNFIVAKPPTIGELQLKGMPAYTLVFTYTDPNLGEQKGANIGAIIDGKAYAIILYTTPEKFDDDPQIERTLMTMINSFKIKEPTTTTQTTQCQLGQEIDPNTGDCVKIPEVCDDGVDNDFDGLLDEQDVEECPTQGGGPGGAAAANRTGGVPTDGSGPGGVPTDGSGPGGVPTDGSGPGGVPTDGEGTNAGGSNFQPFDPSAVTSPQPIAGMFPLIVLASIVVIGGIALGKYSKNRNRGRRIRIPPSAVVDIHTKGGTRE